jgi:hypothetical protein
MIARRIRSRLAFGLLALVAAIALPLAAEAAATIVIVNGDPAGVGFNDPTLVAPVGGNPGTTLGQQRLNAFQAAANTWGATITSSVPISVLATFEALTCNATSAVLGSAGATEVWSAPGLPLPTHWYHFALANKLAGIDLDPTTAQIRARFNVNLGSPTCLAGVGWYLGLDGNHGSQIDLVTVLLHEFAHGLGFSTTTSGATGAYFGGKPSVFDHFTKDTSTGMWWDQMTNAQRATSAINPRRVVWDGAQVTSEASSVLSPGTPLATVTAPPALAGGYAVGPAAFGPQLAAPGVTGEVMPVITQSANGPGCDPFNVVNQVAVAGKFALIDRGVCGFTVKVKNAQNAGAIGVIIGDNVAGGPPGGMGGTDPTITIPSVRVSLADANAFKDALKYRSRTHSGMFATLGVDLSQMAGADPIGQVLLFTPSPFQPGSSVSHWDTIAFPNLLMEPNINGDLTHSVIPPWDLTFALLRDIGW